MRSLPARGMTLVDVLVGTALVITVFAGLFGILRASLKVSGLAKVKAIATTVATSQMEYIRSLPYDDIGTLGGIPAGLVPQYASSTNGGLVFDIRTYIEYADDGADGTGVADTNGITTDYKHLKVVASYTVGGVTRDVTLVSNAAPLGIESTSGGGTLLVYVVNAVGAPVSGAAVRIQNASTSPTIDFSTFSDSFGTVNLPGAPASTGYEVSVLKTGYSSAQTYDRDATNANPAPGHLTVVAGSTTSGTFAIDQLATLILRTFSPIAPFVWMDAFDDSSKLASVTSTQVVGGALTLSGMSGTYPAAGSAVSSATAPSYLAEWNDITFSATALPATSARIFVADASSSPLPDAVVPGNASGFVSGPIDLSGVSTTTYPELRLLVSLTSTDPGITPTLDAWSIGYDAGPFPLPDVPFALTGAKTTGSTSGGAPIYKTTTATSTGSDGTKTLTLEWDSYDRSISGYTTVSEDPLAPYELLPGTTVEANVILTP